MHLAVAVRAGVSLCRAPGPGGTVGRGGSPHRRETGNVATHGAGAPRARGQRQILSNTGHFNVEIDIGALEELSTGKRQVREDVDGYDMADGRTIYLIADGRLVNLSAAEGHPAAVMDMSFANQALSAEYVVQNADKLEKRVYDVPTEIDKEIARLKLASMGVDIDTLTEEQAKYLASWDEGT